MTASQKMKSNKATKPDFKSKMNPANMNVISRRPVDEVWESKDETAISSSDLIGNQTQFAMIFGVAHFIIGFAIIGLLISRTMGIDS